MNQIMLKVWSAITKIAEAKARASRRPLVYEQLDRAERLLLAVLRDEAAKRPRPHLLPPDPTPPDRRD